jgi:sec-independent protein translocase protein TatA
MGISIWHLLVVVLVVVVLFGKGRISPLMEDLGKGISSFKKGLKGEEETPSIKDETRKD